MAWIQVGMGTSPRRRPEHKRSLRVDPSLRQPSFGITTKNAPAVILSVREGSPRSYGSLSPHLIAPRRSFTSATFVQDDSKKSSPAVILSVSEGSLRSDGFVPRIYRHPKHGQGKKRTSSFSGALPTRFDPLIARFLYLCQVLSRCPFLALVGRLLTPVEGLSTSVGCLFPMGGCIALQRGIY